MYNKKDHYHGKAKKEGYRARSAYKLKEIQKKYKIFRQGNNVLDLGCAPGAWTQVALEYIGSGQIVGIDLEQMEFSSKRVHAIQMDIFELKLEELPIRNFDCVLSDMAPKTSGVRFRDQARSMKLVEQAMLIAKETLSVGGCLVMKMFEGSDTQTVVQTLKESYSKVELFRPQSTRKSSIEIYILGINKK